MLAAELGQYLHDQNVGVKDDNGSTGTIFVDNMPDSPDEAIAIMTTSSGNSPFHQPYDYKNLQVLVRGTSDPRVSESKAQTIYDLLQGFTNGRFVATTGAWVVICKAMNTPVNIGKDENGRVRYSVNFQLYIYNQNRIS